MKQVLPVPDGYPAHLPRPVLEDGGLYLDPFPGFTRESGRKVTDEDIAWVMVALQPLVMQYAPTPYDVNWVTPGWGSGKAHVMGALSGYIGARYPWGLPASRENWLELPREPSGFDAFLISLNTAIPTLMQKLFDSIMPGTGTAIKTLVGKSVYSPSGGPVNLGPVYEQINSQQDAGTGSNNTMLFAGILAAAAIWWYYEGDT